jgi:hypothetical protein
MVDARRRECWAHTSSILALLANIHRDRRKKPSPYKPDDFTPYPHERGQAVQTAPIEILKQVFVDRG